MPLCAGLLALVAVIIGTPGPFFSSLNRQFGNTFEIGTHAGHEASIMGGPVAWVG